MMRFGEHISTIDYETDYISLLESGVIEISDKFKREVERGEFIER